MQGRTWKVLVKSHSVRNRDRRGGDPRGELLGERQAWARAQRNRVAAAGAQNPMCIQGHRHEAPRCALSIVCSRDGDRTTWSLVPVVHLASTAVLGRVMMMRGCMAARYTPACSSSCPAATCPAATAPLCCVAQRPAYASPT